VKLLDRTVGHHFEAFGIVDQDRFPVDSLKIVTFLGLQLACPRKLKAATSGIERPAGRGRHKESFAIQGQVRRIIGRKQSALRKVGPAILHNGQDRRIGAGR
jgi:hypothetical protein